jgi:hypothetical protein
LVDQLIAVPAADRTDDYPSIFVVARLPDHSSPIHAALLEAIFIVICQSLGSNGRDAIDKMRDMPSEVKKDDFIPANVDPGIEKVIQRKVSRPFLFRS